MKIESTRTINGIFVLLIFFRHSFSYLDVSRWDYWYKYIDSKLGQLIVVSFLMFSGYGIMNSLEIENNCYPLLGRIKRLWLKYMMALIGFSSLNMIFHREYSASTYIAAIFAWESIGNSNWYIYAIINLYFFTFIAFSITKNNNKAIAILIFLCFIYTLVLYKCGKETWWYDTIWAYIIGMILRQRITVISDCLKNISVIKWSISSLGLLVCLFSICVMNRYKIWALSLYAAIFGVFLVVFFSKIEIKNRLLLYLGKYCFEIYIYQRIVMIAFSELGFCSINALIVAVTFIVTIMLAIIIRKIENYLFVKGEN